MIYLARIAAWSISAFGIILFLAQIVTHEIGFQIGVGTSPDDRSQESQRV
jgi:hypothetical protein